MFFWVIKGALIAQKSTTRKRGIFLIHYHFLHIPYESPTRRFYCLNLKKKNKHINKQTLTLIYCNFVDKAI